MALHGKEKIWYLINRIVDEREIKPDDEIIGIKNNFIVDKYDQLEIRETLTALEKANAAKLEHTPTDQTWNRWLVKILPGFDAYVKRIEADPDYQEKWLGKKPKPKPKGLLDPDSRVDFTKSKEYNKDRYISVRQIQELDRMPEEERTRIMRENLTEKQVKDVKGYKETALKLVQNITKGFGLEKLTKPTLHDVEFALPPNYQAQTVGLLKQLVAKEENDHPASLLIAPTYYRDTKQLVFCNRIIDASKGKDFAIFCNEMFYNAKPRKQPQQIGELLYKWQDPNHKNTKRVHNAVSNFNNYIAKFTTINDLFYIKNKQVHFNSNYI